MGATEEGNICKLDQARGINKAVPLRLERSESAASLEEGLAGANLIKIYQIVLNFKISKKSGYLQSALCFPS